MIWVSRFEVSDHIFIQRTTILSFAAYPNIIRTTPHRHPPLSAGTNHLPVRREAAQESNVTLFFRR